MRILRNYGADGFSDIAYDHWLELIHASGFKIIKITPSFRPWNYGGLIVRLKNSIAHLVSLIMPLRSHYLVGFLCRK